MGQWIERLQQLPYKRLLLLLVLFLMALRYFRYRKDKQASEDISDNDLKDKYGQEDGVFPWEANNDDNPKKIPPSAKRKPIIHDGPKRGKW
ncbi:hypothetical protein [Enterococcus sp. DIV0876]|uniref:hypothetical protein n=1 Tax=Enterococcus sp. DIV0876 TaxID=2774633 RepID=UPI003D2FAD51